MFICKPGTTAAAAVSGAFLAAASVPECLLKTALKRKVLD